MKEIVNTVLNKLTELVPGVDSAILLGICGGIVILVLFFIALAISAGCKITRYRKQLISSTKFLNDQEPVDENNVDKIYAEIAKHPERVQKGWQCFMDQRIGYPSDYITEKEVLSAREFSGKGAFAKVFLVLLGAVVWALVAVAGFMSVTVSSDNIMSAIVSLEFVIIPIAVYIISILLLDIAFNRKIRRLQMGFMSFCEMLDSKVIVSDKDEREFVSDNLEEINKRVEELIASRIDNEEVIEVITAPKVEEIEESDEIEEEIASVQEPEEPYVEEEPYEEVPQPRIIAEMTADERENYFKLLINLVETAINDERCDDDDYAMIAAAINDESISSGAVNDPEDMAIFEECFRMLAAKMSN